MVWFCGMAVIENIKDRHLIVYADAKDVEEAIQKLKNFDEFKSMKYKIDILESSIKEVSNDIINSLLSEINSDDTNMIVSETKDMIIEIVNDDEYGVDFDNNDVEHNMT